MHQNQPSVRCERSCRGLYPAVEADRTLAMRHSLARMRRGRMAAGLVKRRIHHDVLEGPRSVGDVGRDLRFDDRDSGAGIVRLDVGTGQPGGLGFALDADDLAAWQARPEAQCRGGGAAAGIENRVSRCRGHSRRQEDRIDCYSVACGGLRELDPAAEQPVGGRIGTYEEAPALAASRMRRARSRSLSSTMTRRGKAPIEPSTALIY